ncbi:CONSTITUTIVE EXPRESSER OF PR GENES 1, CONSTITUTIVE EXPRESSER OF PR GENES 30 [Hibiscus trionum]|uniref:CONSTITUTIVE EXPRESSER OF PR GENES 1, CONSTITUTIVE EXPRESSER OF PR GENES 30 n=1 Tax=Hibiscus trionum TaxID=183268 RepID=A0A9W7LH28_HIBTR|nr:CONSTITUTIVE EXPRESSER OF PR GENES 1, CONSTITUTIVE EXPRESSER OF PR GENES 30 [Hibiscus trionum]
MATFPTDIITDILSRLPTKTLSCFKCVSKPWSSLIHDSNFAKLHLHNSFKTNANVKLVLDGRTEDDEYKTYSIDFDSLGNLEELSRPYSIANFGVSSRIFGSCNGLLAVHHDEAGIALWNPSTRTCYHLPKLTIKDVFNHDYENVLGFGYDAVSNDYKVVQMPTSGKPVVIYSLKANSWRRIKDCPYQISYHVTQDGVFSNGSLHWVGDEEDEHGNGRLIFGLDLGVEEFHRVPESDISHGNFGYRSVGVLGGKLCVFREYDDKDHVNLWVMKESWTEVAALSRKEWWQPGFFYTRAIAYCRRGDRLLLEDGARPRQPAWFNLEKKTREILDIPGAPQHFAAMIYVESLVSPVPIHH